MQTKNGYTLYHTSAAPTEGGLNLFTISQPGVQTLTVSPNRKFILFDLDVALEWDARKDARFMAQLDFDLKRTSELLFDWTDGQVALGKVRVFHDARRVPKPTASSRGTTPTSASTPPIVCVPGPPRAASSPRR